MTLDTEKYYPSDLLNVEEAVAGAYGLKRRNLHERFRDLHRSTARFVVWYIAHSSLGYSYSRLGRLYKRDHSTIIHGVQRVRGTSLQAIAEDIYKDVAMAQ